MLGPVRTLLAVALLAFAAHAGAAWRQHAPMGVPRQEIGVAVIGTTLWTVAGIGAQGTSAAVEVWDAATDTWATRAPLPVALHHVGAAAVDGILYSIGGLDETFEGVDVVFAYDPATDVWTPRAPLPQRRGAMGVAVVDGRIYAAGGYRNGTSIADFAVYDPVADAWTSLPPMPTARDHLAAAAIGGLVYAAGGRDAGVLRGALERYDPATAQWTSLAPLPTPRGGLMAAAFGGRLFTFGGEGNVDLPSGVFSETEAYDPARATWITLEPMALPRHGTVAAALGDAIHVPGGATRQGVGVVGSHDAFVPPAGDPMDVRRLRVGRRGRLRLRAVLPELPAATGDAPVVVTVTGGGGAGVLALDLPAGSLRATARGFVHKSAAGVVRLVRRRRDATVRLRVPVSPPPSGAATIALELGGVAFGGEATLR